MRDPSTPGGNSIGSYVVRLEGGRLSIARRPGPLQRIGLCKCRPILSLMAATEVADVVVSRRPLRGSESKRPWIARPYRVEILGPDREPLCRTLGFRFRADADRLAQLVGGYSARLGG